MICDQDALIITNRSFFHWFLQIASLTTGTSNYRIFSKLVCWNNVPRNWAIQSRFLFILFNAILPHLQQAYIFIASKLRAVEFSVDHTSYHFKRKIFIYKILKSTSKYKYKISFLFTKRNAFANSAAFAFTTIKLFNWGNIEKKIR